MEGRGKEEMKNMSDRTTIVERKQKHNFSSVVSFPPHVRIRGAVRRPCAAEGPITFEAADALLDVGGIRKAYSGVVLER